MTTKLYKYVAMIGEMRITSILAKDHNDAVKQAEDALSQAGREFYLKVWVDNGKVVVLDEQ